MSEDVNAAVERRQKERKLDFARKATAAAEAHAAVEAAQDMLSEARSALSVAERDLRAGRLFNDFPVTVANGDCFTTISTKREAGARAGTFTYLVSRGL